MVSIILIVMNVKSLIINISTIRLIHTSSINDSHNNTNMIRYKGRAVMMTMYMLQETREPEPEPETVIHMNRNRYEPELV